MKGKLLRFAVSLILIAGMVLAAVPVIPVVADSSGTTTLTITSYAVDGTTILRQKTLSLTELKALPVLNDEGIQYYHQGPTFDAADLWDTTETVNLKDMGTPKGTSLLYLCGLVGGAPAGSVIQVKASDNFNKQYAADDLSAMPDAGITPIIAWNNEALGGDVPAYDTGMRLIFMDENTNADGKHVFGHWDMHENMQEAYWHYYDGEWPSSSGLSVQNVDRINIYTDLPAPDVLFDGTVDLTPGETFSKTAYDSSVEYTGISRTTPLGALDIAAATGSFTYDVTDKNYATSGSLLLDNIGSYNYQKTPRKAWYAYVNGIYKDGYNNAAGGLNLIELVDADMVEFYFVDGSVADPTNLNAVALAASAVVRTVANIETAPTVDILFDGTVSLTTGDTFDVTAYNSDVSYTVSRTTPLGALDAAATSAGFTFDVTDKNYAASGALLLDNVGTYLRDKTNGIYWYAYVNDVYKDGYDNGPDGLNIIELNEGDTVEFYYAAGISDPTDLAAVQLAATAAVKTVVAIVSPVDVLFDGTADLTPGETFSKTAYNSSVEYTGISRTTPLGALDAVAAAEGFTYDVTDKNYATSGALLLDNVGTYIRKSPGYWYAYVNDVYKDGYNNPDGALNLITLNHGDKVEFYYAVGIADPADLTAVQASATAAVKMVVSTMDVLYDGTVLLTPGQTFDVVANYLVPEGTTYTVDVATPLGALNTAADAAGFTYTVSDKKIANGFLLLNDIDVYTHNNPGKWYVYVNDVYKDGFNDAADGINILQVVNNDTVEFYYAAGITDPADLVAVKAAATATVKTVVTDGSVPSDWILQLTGAKNDSVTKAEFEDGLACPSSGHYVEWTDADDIVWGGIPLWVLVAMVDDEPDEGPLHFNFNDDLAAQDYKVTVIAGDGWSATFDSSAIARNDGFIVANTCNGAELPLKNASGKDSWPLHLKGSSVFGGQQVGNIVEIELTDLPAPPEGWTLEMVGEIGDVVTQAEFEDGLACTGSGHYVEWTDSDSNVWSGVPLWVLLGVVDDIETSSHWTFNDDVADAGYTVNVIAVDGYTRNFDGAAIKRSNNYIIANKMNGAELTDKYPLRLVGDGVATDGVLKGSAVGNIARIEIPELETPEAAPGSWNLALSGKITDVLSQAEFEAALACPGANHQVEWTDGDGNVWSGMPLWHLAGWVDDRLPHEFSTLQVAAGYTIVVKAGDGYNKGFDIADVAWSTEYIVANSFNGVPLTDSWPLRLVGDGAPGGLSVGNIVEIELIDFGATGQIPQLRIVKYKEDRTTILSETTVDYLWMEQNLDVIGDGTTVYKYEGITNDAADIWDADETYPGGFKIQNAVKGTRVSDLCALVGGMGADTEITFIASDGFKTVLPYYSIYPDADVYARQGDAILAWWGDGNYVPAYKDGMRLFFTPGGDNVYGQWDMHETLAEEYWHYYYGDVLYPSCAGLSAKYITTIEIHSVPETPWTLELDGTDIGGLSYTISKNYFEQALACQFGANHKKSYTDGSGKVWTGMPLWFLAGFVDDQDLHSNNAFNEALAAAGYDIVITAGDGYTVTISSADIIRSNDYIVANTLNGAHFADTDSYWPLRLVGPTLSGSMKIGNIVKIELKKHVLYNDGVTLQSGTTFDVTAYTADAAGTTYTVSRTTPLGALDAAATAAGFSYAVGDKKMATQGYMLLDDIGVYTYNNPGKWYVYVNDVYKDGYANADDAINNLVLSQGDKVEFYYAAGITDASDTDAVKTVAVAAVLTTVSVTQPPAPGSSGPGGGGGGGGATDDKRFTNISGSADTNGVLWENIIALSVDNLAELHIGQGTTALNRNGYPLFTITVTTVGNPQDPDPGTSRIGETYDFSPDGTTFTPAVLLVLHYDPAMLPAGMNEADLYITLWDEATQSWVRLDCVVDTEANTVSAYISHFSRYTIAAGIAPAAFAVSGLTLSSQEVDTGDDLSASVTVTNTGDLAGSYTAVLAVGGAGDLSMTVTLKGRESRSINFDLPTDTAGDFAVSIASLSAAYTVAATGTVAEVIPPEPTQEPVKDTPESKPEQTATAPTPTATSTAPTQAAPAQDDGSISGGMIALYIVVGLIAVGAIGYFIRRRISVKK